MDNLSEWVKPELLWFLFGFVMFLLEFAMPGLIIFFFGIGAWFVAIICFFVGISINIQLSVFLISSVLLIVFLRKRLKTIFIGRITSKQTSYENLDGFVGEKAIVAKQIAPNIKGKVEFHGSNWDAESDEFIEEGVPVEIIGRNSIIFKVKSLKGR